MCSVTYIYRQVVAHDDGPNTVHATALYTYESTNTDELAFNEGDTIVIVDQSEADWWKAEHDGFVFVVPAAYLEATEG